MMKAAFPRQTLRDIFRALRLYGTGVFWRGNPMNWAAGTSLFAAIVNALIFHHALAHHPFSQVIRDNGTLGFLLAAVFLQNVLQTHAFRQIGAAQAPVIPGFLHAHAWAAVIPAAFVPLFLSIILTCAGTPFHTALFFILFNSLPAILGWYSPSGRNTMSAGMRRKRSGVEFLVLVLFLLFITLLSVPDSTYWLMTRPPAVTIPGSACILASLVFAVLSLPNRAIRPSFSEAPTTRTHRIRRTIPTVRKPYAKFQEGNFYERAQMLLAPALRTPLQMDIFQGILVIPILTSLLVLLMFLFGSRDSFTSAWAATAHGMVIFVAFNNGWMMSRDHWPFLLITGQFGTRLQFVQTAFRSALIVCGPNIVLRTGSLTIPLAIINHSSILYCGIASIEIILSVTALVFTAALPFMFTRQPADGLIRVFSIGPIILSQLCNPLVLGLEVDAIVTAVLLIIGLWCFLAAPSRIARADWAFGTE